MQDHVVLFHPPRKVAGKATVDDAVDSHLVQASSEISLLKLRRRVDETIRGSRK